ncbi:hypothetical protein LTR36_010766 [Oleoguttula mirabilis]|uniref:GAR domain-containing protein n=1 Tax=Oleoguttula mirabilis TaxID=1507867 RepID=A0AAV9JRG0_9PEZI|nr:hypothetical protein LTR36_010766 [Oleoguttula mirabilis]
MSLPNPAINPPNLSARRPLHARSASRSPVRPPARDLDPLLRDLSPTTTLRAFSSEPPRPSDKHDSAFSANFDSASNSERALGAKAAQTCLDLRSWTRELQRWEWLGTFDGPEPARKRMRMSGLSTLSTRTGATATEDDEHDEHELWGSLPAQAVQAYEQRTAEIGQQLDEMDVEQLKDFVLSAHRRAGSGRASLDDSIGAIGAATDLRRLDDFTALITATILQALPYLSCLHRLLDVWTMRLSVLRKTPLYLHDLQQARTDLDHGWAAIAVSPASAQGSPSASFTRETMTEMQSVIQQQVWGLGRRLDGFLDELEGREETVPEAWIEDFEDLETAYGDWVVQAERKVLENEWRTTRDQEAKDLEHERAAQLLLAGHRSYSRKISKSYDLEDLTRDEDALFSPSSRPASGAFDVPGGQQGLHHLHPASNGLLREDSETLADGADQRIKQPKSPNEALIAPEPRSDSPANRSRHVPIVVDYGGDDQDHPSDSVNGSGSTVDIAALPLRAVTEPLSDATAGNDVAPSTGHQEGTAVKKRAAFLDANRSSSLQKQVKSPVRSFEHASNAFTRLFSKKGRSTPEQQSRTSSQRSVTSTKQSTSSDKAASKGEEIIWGGRGPVAPGTVSVSGSKAVTMDATGRSKTTAQRSLSTHTSKTSMRPAAVSFGSSSDSRRAARQRDYGDMPGGFRPRSKSEESRRSHPSTPKVEYEGGVRHLRSTYHAPVETYVPKRLNDDVQPPSARSPEHDYPADWPLASPPETESTSPVKGRAPATDVDAIEPVMQDEEREESSPEISSPRIPMETDVFDRMFVTNFQVTPEEPPRPEYAGNPLATSGSKKRHSPRRKKSGEPTLDAAMLGVDGRQDDLSVATAGPSSPHRRRSGHGYGRVADYLSIASAGPSSPKKRRPKHVDLQPTASGEADRAAERNSSPGTGSISTPISEGEVQDARSVGYFPLQPSPEAVSRASSSATVKNGQWKTKTPPVSPMLLRLRIPDMQVDAGAEATDDGQDDGRPVLLNRASLASIECRPRSQLRSIIVTRSRRNSDADTSSAPQTPRESAPVSAIEPGSSRRTPSGPLGYKGMIFFPSPPGPRGSLPTSPVSPISAEQSPFESRLAGLPPSTFADHDDTADSPVSARSEDSPAPLNAAMQKRHGRRPTRAAPASTKKQSTPLKPGEDSFDRHVSEVLERLPSAAIKFRSRPGAETPVNRTAEPRNYAGPRPKTGRVASRVGGSGGVGDLTLAPAEASPKKSTAENEVKLYHLTQAGRDEPIKLFVRLVGEGERVMVRVGGGWADLADYLRQYAEHHGSRTVSGAGIELQTAGGTPLGTGSRKVSSSATEPKSNKTPSTPATAVARPGSRAAEVDSSTDEQPRFSMRDSTYIDDESPSREDYPSHQQTPTNTIATQRSTPKSTSTKASSRPSTADSLGRPGSRQGPDSLGRPVGEAQKAKWVESMMMKAKVASAEKSKEEKANKYFGELGKAGGTRRVIFRQSSGAVGNAENAKP